MTMNTGNPAQRLFDIVSKAERNFYGLRGNNISPVSWTIWSKVFEIGNSVDFTRDEQIEIISRVNQSRKLVDEVEELLKKVENLDHEKYLRPFPKLKTVFTSPFQLGNSFEQIFGINAVDLTILEFGIDAVAGVYKEKVVDEDQLKALLSEIQNLYEQVIDLEIDKNLKRILLDMLKIMENAIHEYRIRGVERLGEALEQLVGMYLFNKEIIENSDVVEVEKVKKILSKFGSMYSFAADTVQLLGAGEVIKNTGEFITKLLGSGE